MLYQPVETTRRMPKLASPRGPELAFVAVLVLAFPLLLILGSEQWFFLDEWDFLAGRAAFDLGDLFRPHNEHWSTVPILVYRLLWSAFGLTTYVPYQAVVVALHLTAAALLWFVMRRSGVHPWIATLAGTGSSAGPQPLSAERSEIETSEPGTSCQE